MKPVCMHLSKYFLPSAHSIRKLCSPLYHHYNIDVFVYFRYDMHGNYSLLTSSPELTETWHDNEFYHTNSFCINPQFLTPVRLLTTKVHVKERQCLKQKHRAQDEVVIIKKPSADVTEGFCFDSTLPNNKIKSIAFSYPHVFEAFIDYFKREAKKYLSFVYENPISILPYKGAAFNQPLQTTTDLSTINATNQEFINELALKPLTAAERRCVEFYRLYYTAEETALKINCSKRTVEAHFANILKKLGLKKKRDILRLI